MGDKVYQVLEVTESETNWIVTSVCQSTDFTMAVKIATSLAFTCPKGQGIEYMVVEEIVNTKYREVIECRKSCSLSTVN